jgi:hypothetical protein
MSAVFRESGEDRLSVRTGRTTCPLGVLLSSIFDCLPSPTIHTGYESRPHSWELARVCIFSVNDESAHAILSPVLALTCHHRCISNLRMRRRDGKGCDRRSRRGEWINLCHRDALLGKFWKCAGPRQQFTLACSDKHRRDRSYRDEDSMGGAGIQHRRREPFREKGCQSWVELEFLGPFHTHSSWRRAGEFIDHNYG